MTLGSLAFSFLENIVSERYSCHIGTDDELTDLGNFH